MSQTPATVAFVGLGSNLGDSIATVRAAMAELETIAGTQVLRVSRLYRTAAWGVTAQPDFINAVAMLHTRCSPQQLLAAMLDIERHAGRHRLADGSDRWGPRTLDLDLLMYGEAVIDEAGLHVPHPRLQERAFVLVPLAEIAPDAVIPGIGTAREALSKMETAQVQGVTYAEPPNPA